jgi:subtilisin-like proprotein convertase family protein
MKKFYLKLISVVILVLGFSVEASAQTIKKAPPEPNNNSFEKSLIKQASQNQNANHKNIHFSWPCQDFNITVNTNNSISQSNNGIFTIESCPYDTISLTAIGLYPFNDSLYHQSDSSSSFIWSTNNGVVSGKQISVPSITGSIQNMILTALDSILCPSSDTITILIKTSPNANFGNTKVIKPNLCLGETTNLIGNAQAGSLNYSQNHVMHNGISYLPDGTGVSYTSSLNIVANPNNSLLNAQDLNIRATLEHSYLGDLNISITCPNGQSATLKQYPGGTNTYLGEPIDNNSQQVPGIGYEYYWNMQGSTTMAGAAGVYSHNFTDLSGNSYTNHNYLPPSSSYPTNSTASSPYPIVNYLPSTSFNSLVGCPLNGNWTITITDNLAIDNGFLFSWGIDITPSQIPNAFQNIISQSWVNNTTIIQTNGDSIKVLPTDTGLYTYTYSAVDSFGCTFDTNVYVRVNPIPHANFPRDTILCGNQGIILQADSNLKTFLWSTNSSLESIYIDSTGVGFGNKVISLNMIDTNNCSNSDTILIQFTDCSGINTTGKDIKIKAYPNPSNGVLVLSGKNIENNANSKFQIFDASGKLIQQKSILIKNGEINEYIDIKDVNKGIYYLVIKLDRQVKTIKILKQ